MTPMVDDLGYGIPLVIGKKKKIFNNKQPSTPFKIKNAKALAFSGRHFRMMLRPT